ncbi:FAD-binding protein, partial [Rhodococcus sp. PAE-6]|nr:FAD-binding protein [Rhodococcus sp. PAE-6]
KYSVAARIEARKGNPPRERVVQDIVVPLERTQEFVEWFLEEIPIEPIWLCPLQLRDIESSPDAGRQSTSYAQRPWPL